MSRTADDTRPISDRLAALGYGHRPSNIEGKRDVFHVASNTVMGQWDASEAVAFLERMGG